MPVFVPNRSLASGGQQLLFKNRIFCIGRVQEGIDISPRKGRGCKRVSRYKTDECLMRAYNGSTSKTILTEQNVEFCLSCWVT